MERTKQIIMHVKKRQTPPPKSLWVSPTGLRTFLRTLLKQLGVPVFQTVDDHKQEVIFVLFTVVICSSFLQINKLLEKLFWRDFNLVRNFQRISLAVFSIFCCPFQIMTFIRDNHFDVLVAEGAEYLFMDPPRFMFSTSLKLTFKGKLEVQELAVDDLCRHIDLHPNRLCLVAALLG